MEIKQVHGLVISSEKELDDLKKCCDQYTTVLGKVK